MENDPLKKIEDIHIQLYLTVMIVIAALIHVFLAAYFFFDGLYIVGWVNVADFLIWVVAFLVNKSGRIRAASFIAILKLITFSLVGTYLLGLNVNVQWIVLTAMLPTVLYLKFTRKEKIFLVFLMFLVVNLQVFWGENFTAPFAQDGNVFLKIVFANLVIMAIIIELILNTLVNRRMAVSHKKEIEAFKRISYTDPLTKLSNRRYADIFFEQLQQSPQKEKHCVAMIDIDDFKTVNDTYGHDVGDATLIKISEVLREKIRSRDLACRWGGEEILLVLCGCNLQNGIGILENIRKTIRHTAISVEGKNIHCTVTIGAAILDEDNIEESIRICDKNLYEGKRNGKNKVIS